MKEPKGTLFIDAIHRLGVAYHFENEIENYLQEIQNKFNVDNYYEDNLQYVSLSFRLLRQHGFYVSSDIFERFKDENGRFKECLRSDIEGLLNLYEASYVGVDGENIVDEALTFCSNHLSSIVEELSSPMAEQVSHSLKLPLHRRSLRLESKNQISFYESNPSHNKTLLRFAKLDFNYLQVLHNTELRDFTRWSRDFDSRVKLPKFSRERVVEGYFWSLGAYFEPKYSYARMCWNKWFKIISIIDDIYDSYGLLDELQVLTQSIQRWDKSCIDQLPDYMKLFYEAMLDTVGEMEQELAKEGRSYAVYYAKQQLMNTSQAYLQEARWRNEKYVPTYDEYMKNAIFSSGSLFVIITSYLGMGNIANKDSFEWLHPNSRAPRASCVLTRLANDISGHKFEKKRDHATTSVESYMSQFGITSEVEAYKQLQFEMEEAWKDINTDMVGPTNVPMPIVQRVINLSRVLCDFYSIGEDRYTMGKFMKPSITAVLIHSFDV
ncbi:unnamed protein product [Amaranthus hypochondriacus]